MYRRVAADFAVLVVSEYLGPLKKVSSPVERPRRSTGDDTFLAVLINFSYTSGVNRFAFVKPRKK